MRTTGPPMWKHCVESAVALFLFNFKKGRLKYNMHREMCTDYKCTVWWITLTQYDLAAVSFDRATSLVTENK